MMRDARLQKIWRRWLSKKGSWKHNWVVPKEKKAAVTCEEEVRKIGKELKSKAKELGLPLAYITSNKPSSRVKEYEEWLEKGHHGEMGYMARKDRIDRRKDPSLILPGLCSVVMVGLPYWPGESGFPAEHAVGAAVDGDAGVVSCYAWGTDYHRMLHDRLHALGKWLTERAGGAARYYADTGAILERDFAARSGMGFVGKNSMLIHPRLGSGIFLGALFTTVPLLQDGGDEAPLPRRGKPGCGSCVRCRELCPTGAIVEDRVVDARRCISYLTIELKSSIPEELRSLMGARIYGCDICQQVCPWNRFDWQGTEGKESMSPLFGAVGRKISVPSMTKLLSLTDDEFKKQFQGSAVSRIGRDRMARNAAVGLGNVGGKSELEAVEHAANADRCEIVREHAAWAVKRIRMRMAAQSR